MKEIFDLLSKKERRILSFLCFLLIFALLFYFFVSLGEKRTYFSSLESLSKKKENFKKISIQKNQEKKELIKWHEAHHDIEELKEQYFYKGENSIEKLRGDLQKIFNENKIRISTIKYDYDDLEKDKFNRVKATFTVSGPYFYMKKFIYSVEKFPKFLLIEKIDFSDVDSKNGELKLKITLAGYYES